MAERSKHRSAGQAADSAGASSARESTGESAGESAGIDASHVDPGQFVRQHQAGVWRYLRALGCEAALADDLTQETFLAVLQRPFQQYSDAATAAYLRKVAHNQFVSLYRKSGREIPVEDIDAFNNAWAHWVTDASGHQLIEALRECLQQLGDRARLALDMRFAERKSRAQIAAAVGLGEHGAKNLMQRAKAKLRKCIDGKVR